VHGGEEGEGELVFAVAEVGEEEVVVAEGGEGDPTGAHFFEDLGAEEVVGVDG
jgi:hypothetical protein